MRAEYYRLNYALTECATRRWPITVENVRLLDALGPVELLGTIKSYDVQSNGRSAVQYPTLAESRRWPRLGRIRRILEHVYRHANAEAGLALAPAASRGPGAASAADLLLAFFRALERDVTASPQALRKQIAAERERDELAVLDLIEAGQPLRRELLEELVKLAAGATEPLRLPQLVAVLASWQPLKDEQIHAGLLSYTDICELEAPAEACASTGLPRAWVVLLGTFYHLELDTAEMASILTDAGLRMSRGQLQSWMNQGLKRLYEAKSRS